MVLFGNIQRKGEVIPQLALLENSDLIIAHIIAAFVFSAFVITSSKVF